MHPAALLGNPFGDTALANKARHERDTVVDEGGQVASYERYG